MNPLTFEKPTKGARKRWGSEGAVVVEFAVVLLPLLITFFSFIQVGKVYTSHLVMKHAAITAARAAAVVTKNGDNNPYATGDEDDVQEAAKRAMGRWAQGGAIERIKVKIDDQSDESDPYGMVTVSVTADIVCGVPLASRIVCFPKGRITKTVKASYPHQGAVYKEENSDGEEE